MSLGRFDFLYMVIKTIFECNHIPEMAFRTSFAICTLILFNNFTHKCLDIKASSNIRFIGDSCIILYKDSIQGLITRPENIEVSVLVNNKGDFYKVNDSVYFVPTLEQIEAAEDVIGKYFENKIIKYDLNNSTLFRQYFGARSKNGISYLLINVFKIRRGAHLPCDKSFTKVIVKWYSETPGENFFFYHKLGTDTLFARKNGVFMPYEEALKR